MSYSYMVVNGACKWKDMKHFETYLQTFGKGMDVRMEYLDTQQLVALQGDGAKSVVARLAPSLDLTKMNFMTGIDCAVAGAACLCILHRLHMILWTVIVLLLFCVYVCGCIRYRYSELPSDSLRIHWRRWLRDISVRERGSASR